MNSGLIAFIAVLSAFFLSGFSALVYETLWVRILSLVFGNTTTAVSAVLSAFMAGLSLGSVWGGRFSDSFSKEKLLPLFILAEVLTAAAACLSLPVIHLSQSLVLKAGILNIPLVAQSAAWFAVSFPILAVPAFFMGATLPILTRWSSFLTSSGKPERFLNIFYGINTLGGVAGVAVAGFFAIPLIGITKTFLLAGCFNLASAGIVFLASRPDMRSLASAAIPDTPAEPERTNAISMKYFPAAILFITGTAAMICEVAWSRAFALVLGSSTYSFTIMLLTVLLGLASGSIAFGFLRKFTAANTRGLAFLLAFTSAALLLYLPTINFLPYFFVRLFPFAFQQDILIRLVQFILCFSYVFLPSFLMGMIFPWAVSAAEPGKSSIGADTGFYYGANTVGNIAGSAAAGLLIMPLIGIEKTLLLAVILYAAASIAALFMARGMNKRVRLVVSACFALIIISGIALRPKWDPYIMNSGAFLYAPEYSGAKGFREFILQTRTNRLLYVKDGISSTIAAFEAPWGERFLRVNGKTDASTAGDVPAQLLTAYLPYLLHPGKPAATAMIIGMGSGMTAGALAVADSIDSVFCAEIEPAVLKTLPLFSGFNHNLQFNPKLRVVIADARHYLSAVKTKYDIIASEPSNPWIAGVSSLFTRESFELCRKRLNPGGIYCQWFHIYSMSEDDFKMVMNTFASAFPHVMLMAASNTDLMMLGSDSPWNIDYEKISNIFRDNQLLKGDMALIGLNHPFTFIANTFMLNDAEFRKYCEGAPLHFDDRPTLEFSAPNYLRRNEIGKIFSGILEAKKAMLPEGITGFEPAAKDWELLYNLSGEGFMRSKYIDRAEAAFQEALKYNPSSARTLTNLGRINSLQFNHLKAEELLRKALKIDPDYAIAWFHLGMLYIDQGMEDKGLECLEKGLDISPFDPMGCLQVSKIYSGRGKNGAAQKLLKRALTAPIANRDVRVSLIYMLQYLELQ
ncbi:MAG: fused MFS/spermidine synthase [Elusimicrobiota bacterium]